MGRWWAVIVALVGAVLLAVIATTPPAPRPANAPLDQFAAGRAMADIRGIARAPHPTGSAENARVRAYLMRRLAGMVLAVRTSSTPVTPAAAERIAAWRGTAGTAPAAVNIVATLAGRDPTLPAVLLMAHYDSVGGSPGAADDGAGVATALETVRALLVAGRPARDIIVLLTDGEEVGLEGATAFFARDPLARRVGVVVNMEARGGGGRASMFETGSDNGAMMRLFQRAVSRPVGTSLSVFIYQHLPNSTDFTPAKQAGLPGFNFAFIGRPGLYHSPLATPDALDQGSVQDMGGQVLDLTRALLAAPVLPGKAADLTFFDAFGLVLLAYPAPLGWALFAGAALLFALAGWRQQGGRDILRGAAATAVLVVLAGVLLYLVNLVSGADGPVNYYDRLAAIPRLQVQAALLCAAAVLTVWTMVGAGRRSATAFSIGAALPLLLLGGAAQWAAPTVSGVLLCPLLLVAAATAAGAFGGVRIGTAAGILAGAIGIGFLLALGFFLLQAVGPDTPFVAALPLALAALFLWPLLPPVARQRGMVTAGALVLLALAIALWVRLDPIAASVPQPAAQAHA
ncbi:M20/M25/M40 family metallo-hydrolase [Sphingomonas hylomeconis]|uniref:Vacuolar membrane protease n=1 Tax=Sphingomonas hylomeconis TaxID=1395958 RepID=A0ABV7SX91_9SPHN|nr:M20/M25/M40 family metallo-hydrolase [Sphingomonas hylomeconis]